MRNIYKEVGTRLFMVLKKEGAVSYAVSFESKYLNRKKRENFYGN